MHKKREKKKVEPTMSIYQYGSIHSISFGHEQNQVKRLFLGMTKPPTIDTERCGAGTEGPAYG